MGRMITRLSFHKLPIPPTRRRTGGFQSRLRRGRSEWGGAQISIFDNGRGEQIGEFGFRYLSDK